LILPCPDKSGLAMTENIPPRPSPLPPRGEREQGGKNISPSTYYIAKKRSFYYTLKKKIEKNF